MRMCPFFSILIPFRDRNIDTLRQCLEGVVAQTFHDFELLLLDYGSKEALSQELVALCEKYSFVQYSFTNTRGRLWNKSVALNSLISMSKGEYVCILDADIKMDAPFLQLVFDELQTLSLPKVLEFRCFQTSPNGTRLKQRTGRGLYTAQRTHLIAKGGYDTFFRVWGVEDDEMIARISSENGANPVFTPTCEPLLHLWHTHDYSLMPTGWLAFLKYEYLPAKQKNHILDTLHLLALKDRPVLHKMASLDNKNVVDFAFNFPIMHSYTLFLAQFSTLQASDFLRVTQKFSYYKSQNSPFKKKILDFINNVVGKLHISYRLVDIATHDTAYIPLLEVRDFLFYFLLNFENQIADYFFEYDKEQITFWVCKKGA